jgi:hypothetical protein
MHPAVIVVEREFTPPVRRWHGDIVGMSHMVTAAIDQSEIEPEKRRPMHRLPNSCYRSHDQLPERP